MAKGYALRHLSVVRHDVLLRGCPRDAGVGNDAGRERRCVHRQEGEARLRGEGMSRAEQLFWLGLALGLGFGWIVAKADWRGLFTEDKAFTDEWHDDDAW